MKALDLFCGLGGWSGGLALEGFDVTGVEIEPKIAALYKHRVIVADVCYLNPEDFMGYDLIVGSPPCRDFSSLGRYIQGRSGPNRVPWKKPIDPEKGLELIHAFLKFVEVAKPTYWLMENVPDLRDHLSIKPRVTCRIGKTMLRCFWGNYPSFLIPKDLGKKNLMHLKTEIRGSGLKHPESWERARIPLPVARALGAAVRQALEEKR